MRSWEDALAHLDEDTAIRALLTVRDASEGPLPDHVLKAVDIILVDSIPPLTSLFPSPSATTLPPSFSRISFFRGDITRTSSPRLGITNACNSALLGCFRPNHLLRADCYTIMEAQGIPEPGGRAKITKAWSFPCGYVLHTELPSKEDEDALFNCYTSCLDLAKEVGTIDAVAFPCISTGVFAFPGDIASQLALRATNEWLTAHPSLNMRIIFTLFLPADVEHCTHALKVVFPSISAEKPKKILPLIPPRGMQAIREADTIMIPAGAGLSVDAVSKEFGFALDYTSPTVFSTLYPELAKSTNMRCLYDTFGGDFPDENAAWVFRLLHAHTILNWGPTPVYEALHKLVHTVPKDYFVGGYALLQCIKPCVPDAYFPIQPFIDRALPYLDRAAGRFPDNAQFHAELLPRCAKCDGDLFLNARAADWFLETPHAAEARGVRAVCERVRGEREARRAAGAGRDSVAGRRMVQRGEGRVTLVRVNGSARDAAVPEELVEQRIGFGLNMGAVEFSEALEDAGIYRYGV
ncbi:hypothetical protein DFH07DRAFT_807360 [Mycena maculata]|uniref:Macro domain-containing protein n=1 Tax=Mycena maculata TaxID=230809 RepID=A0AAD7JR06_9AGAR|nr:hypothetical protein DFH07DRAFT_807360 [Mycena maculata]